MWNELHWNPIKFHDRMNNLCQTTRRRLRAKMLKRRREDRALGDGSDSDEDESDATPPRRKRKKRKKKKVCIYDVIAVSLHYCDVIMILVS